MFAQQQIPAALAAGNGRIAIDEHSSVSCLIHDVTATGLSLTMLDSTDVSGTFVLFVGADARVCTVVRRSDEEIVAAFADLGNLARAANTSARTQNAAVGFGRRRFVQDSSLRRAA